MYSCCYAGVRLRPGPLSLCNNGRDRGHFKRKARKPGLFWRGGFFEIQRISRLSGRLRLFLPLNVLLIYLFFCDVKISFEVRLCFFVRERSWRNVTRPLNPSPRSFHHTQAIATEKKGRRQRYTETLRVLLRLMEETYFAARRTLNGHSKGNNVCVFRIVSPD